MYPRYTEVLLKELLQEFRILYLTGPRQAGKTTLARKMADESGMHYVSLDDHTMLSSAKSDPVGFIQSLLNRQQPIVLDEFQYAPELVSAIKLASDRLAPDERGKFFLTGSADVFSSAKTQEALPGHMARVELYPLSVTELAGGRFNLIDFLQADVMSAPERLPEMAREDFAQALINGGYPELQTKSARARPIWLNSYLQGRLYKDFESIYEAKGDYRTKLESLIPYLAGLSGNLLKYASVANDLAQNDKVVKSYIEALEWMFIVKRLHPFVKNRAKRQTIGMPKLQMVDTGLACHLLGLTTPDQLLLSNFYGGLLESFVVMECFKHMGWSQQAMSVYHYRDKQKNEVDIVLEQQDGRLNALEIKASATVSESDFKGIAKFADFVGPAFKAGFVLYTGTSVLPFRIGDRTFHALPLSILWT
jgi:predicted AAA+ superfamily ATPase